MLDVHQHSDRQVTQRHTQRPQRFETAQMRPQQNAAPTGRHLIKQDLVAGNFDFETIQIPGQKI